MKEVRQHIARVIFINILLSIASLAIGSAWAALWCLVLYRVMGIAYPLRYDLQNPAPFVLCAIGVFSGIGSCWICLKYSIHLSESYFRQVFDKDPYEIDASSDHSGPSFWRRWKEECMFWTGTLPDGLRVQAWFGLSIIGFVLAGFLQLFIYSHFVFGFWTNGEFLSK